MVSIVDFLVCSTSFCRSLLSLEATGLQVHWQGLSASQGMAARSVALASCHFSIKADRILSCFFPSCCTNVRICVCGKFLPISQRCPSRPFSIFVDRIQRSKCDRKPSKMQWAISTPWMPNSTHCNKTFLETFVFSAVCRRIRNRRSFAVLFLINPLTTSALQRQVQR